MFPIMRPILVLVLLCPLAAAAEVYRWVDEQGVAHYSDQPVYGAEPADLPKLTTMEPPPKMPDVTPERGDRQQKTPLRLTLPQPETTFRDARGLVPVAVALEGGLGPNQALRYFLDGRPVVAATRETAVTFQGVNRGAHQISVALVTAGEVGARTAPVTVYLLPPTALTPLTQTAPNPPSEQPAGAPTVAPAGRVGASPAAPRFNTVVPSP